MKRICSLLMVSLIMTFCLTGCGDNTTTTKAQPSSSPQATKSTQETTEQATPSPTEKAKTEDKNNGATDKKGANAKVDTSKKLSGKHHAEIDIKDYGTIKLELDADTAPISTTNFIKLAQEGFYDGLTFHRIISGFMMQGGDPLGNGTGGSEETIQGEFAANNIENNISHKRGVISMARSPLDYNSASSQFFIMQQDSPHLDGEYAAFGEVTEGIEIVDQICENTPVIDDNGTVLAENQPIISTIKVID